MYRNESFMEGFSLSIVVGVMSVRSERATAWWNAPAAGALAHLAQVVRALHGTIRSRQRPERPFDLQRRFALLSLASVGLFSVAMAYLMSHFLSETMVRRDAVVSMEFIASIVEAEDTAAYFDKRTDNDSKAVLDSFFNHVSRLPDIARAHVYATDRTIIWSSSPALVGQDATFNPELDEALDGKLEIEWGYVGEQDKAEHFRFERQMPGTRFVEAYIPIWTKEKSHVIGVVEIYRLPNALFAAIDAGNRLVWAGTAIGGLFLYATLFWIVRRANRIIRAQQHRLVDSETMAAVGEMASAVAHGIRNPLASIRSSAELALDGDADGARESARDILSEADRLDRWVRDLLTYARSDTLSPEAVDINAVVRDSIAGFAHAMERQGIVPTLDLDEPSPRVRGNAAPLGQVVNTIISNALEAMPRGGKLSVITRWHGDRQEIVLQVGDTGPGMGPDVIAQAFRPFFTTKRSGTGLGLPLAQRILLRYGHKIELESAPGRGTTVTLRLATAE